MMVMIGGYDGDGSQMLYHLPLRMPIEDRKQLPPGGHSIVKYKLR